MLVCYDWYWESGYSSYGSTLLLYPFIYPHFIHQVIEKEPIVRCGVKVWTGIIVSLQTECCSNTRMEVRGGGGSGGGNGDSWLDGGSRIGLFIMG
jgi:hypothetical protein